MELDSKLKGCDTKFFKLLYTRIGFNRVPLKYVVEDNYYPGTDGLLPNFVGKKKHLNH